MKVKTKYYNEWSLTEYVYSYRTKLESHIIEFCYELMEQRENLNLSLDEIISKVNYEIEDYKSKNSRVGSYKVSKFLAGRVMSNPPKLFYEMAFRTENRSGSIIICEPIP